MLRADPPTALDMACAHTPLGRVEPREPNRERERRGYRRLQKALSLMDFPDGDLNYPELSEITLSLLFLCFSYRLFNSNR